jgi:hypothetical protein
MRADRPVLPLADIVCASCWSSIDWYMRDCALSNMPSVGEASRIDFSTICRNTASNCWAAFFSAARGSSLARRLVCARLLTSMASWLATLAGVMAR